MQIQAVGERWKRFGTSIFSVMTQQAIKHGAVNLAQGFPDFDGPDEIKHAAIESIKKNRNQYAPATGIPELRQLLSEHQQKKSGISFNPDTEVTVLSGATEALFSTIVAVLQPGDEMIAFAPFYDSYPAAALAAGAVFKTVPLQAPHWTFREEDLRAAITPRTKLLLLNTPHNPTGKVFSRDEMMIIRKLVLEFNLLVMTDEVYEEIIFDDAKHIHFAALPDMLDRTITVSSTSKTYSMTGWKIGYAFAKPHLMEVIRAVHQFTVFCSATPLQWGMVAALQLGDKYFEEFRADYLAKRNTLVGFLNSCGMETIAPQGTYFALGNYSKFSDKEDMDFALWMNEHIKLTAIPLSPFYLDQAAARKQSKYLRFAFCKSSETLEKAHERLQQLRKV